MAAIDYHQEGSCARCGQKRRFKGRRLCNACYWQVKKAGELERYPRLAPGSDVDIAQEAGATYRQLDYWTRQGYLHPDHLGGHGVHRQWSPAEVEVARKMARLVAVGLTPALASRVARGDSDVGHGVRIEVA